MSNVIPEKMVHLESWSANLLQVLTVQSELLTFSRFEVGQ
jgi:hypothetical protein